MITSIREAQARLPWSSQAVKLRGWRRGCQSTSLERDAKVYNATDRATARLDAVEGLLSKATRKTFTRPRARGGPLLEGGGARQKSLASRPRYRAVAVSSISSPRAIRGRCYCVRNLYATIRATMPAKISSAGMDFRIIGIVE